MNPSGEIIPEPLNRSRIAGIVLQPCHVANAGGRASGGDFGSWNKWRGPVGEEAVYAAKGRNRCLMRRCGAAPPVFLDTIQRMAGAHPICAGLVACPVGRSALPVDGGAGGERNLLLARWGPGESEVSPRSCPVAKAWCGIPKGGIRPWSSSNGEHGGLGGVLGRGMRALLPERDETADVSMARTRLNAEAAPMLGMQRGRQCPLPRFAVLHRTSCSYRYRPVSHSMISCPRSVHLNIRNEELIFETH